MPPARTATPAGPAHRMTDPTSPGTAPPDPYRTRVVAVASGKGGVGRTATTAAVAACLAEAGWKVLVVDLDPTGALHIEFGSAAPVTDGWEGTFAQAVATGTPAPDPAVCRPGIGLLTGGDLMRAWEQVSADLADGDPDAPVRLHRALRPLVGDWDMVLVDFPPLLGVAHLAGLVAAGSWLAVTTCDLGALDNLALTVTAASRARRWNPGLRRLGVLLSAVPSRRRATEAVEALAGIDPDLAADVFGAQVRNAPAAVAARRLHALTAVELVEVTRAGARNRISDLRRGLRPDTPRVGDLRTAERLLGDYRQVTNELVSRWGARVLGR